MGTSFPVALRTLYADGGIPRFYRGVVPALFQGTLLGLIRVCDSSEPRSCCRVGLDLLSMPSL